MKGRIAKGLARASGAQIGARTRKVIGCPSCLASGEKSGFKCECGDHFASFDSRGEWCQWVMLRNAERLGQINTLRRQVPMPLNTPNGKTVGKLVLDFVYTENGAIVYADYKGGASTELSAWKIKHFKAQYEQEVVIYGGSR